MSTVQLLGGGASVTDEKIGGTYNSFLSPPTDIHKKKKKKKKKEFKHERKRIKTTKSSAYILAAPDWTARMQMAERTVETLSSRFGRLKETVCASI